MNYDLQKASLWKRTAAWLFDGILTGILAVGFAFLLSLVLGYDTYSVELENAYAEYELEYGVSLGITQEEYEALSDEVRQAYDAASQAVMADTELTYAYHQAVNLMLVITSLGILAGVLIMEYVVPLLLGNGRTIGKKIFGLCVIRTDGVRMNNMQLFVRTILGKYTIETMIPVYLLMMLLWGAIDITGTIMLLILAVAQLVILTVTKTNSAMHDLLAGTVVADFGSQMIFHSTEALIAYQKKVAAERAARQSY